MSGRNITAYVRKETAKKFKEIAKSRGVTVSQMAGKIIERSLSECEHQQTNKAKGMGM